VFDEKGDINKLYESLRKWLDGVCY
jgi:hypothetical protein